MKKFIAVYPISANPPTWGHADIMFRASKKFEKIYWVAAGNPQKKTYFTESDKTEMMEAYVDYYKVKNVVVEAHKGTVIRYAKEKDADFLIRGLRNGNDYIHEFDLSIGNRGIEKEIETICFFTKPHFACLSSSMVRELCVLGERTDQYCLPEVSRKISKILTKVNQIN